MLTEMRTLLDKGLVSEKSFDSYPDLRMYKYKKKVFYRALWNEDENLCEARGLILDTSGKIITLPFRKVFNYQENGTTIRKSAVVKLVEKRNGFFAACSLYEGGVLVSTTGSLESDFVDLAKSKLDLEAVKQSLLGLQEALGMVGTMMFEICHENDPHIVEEDIGAYLIGFRIHESGLLLSEEVLDRVALAYNYIADDHNQVYRPIHTYCTFKAALRKLKTCKHEGYMVYQKGSEKALKLKSPYYLTKKFLMRMGQSKVDFMFDKSESFLETVDEEFFDVIHYITRVFKVESWKGMTDQQRRNVIEVYMYG